MFLSQLIINQLIINKKLSWYAKEKKFTFLYQEGKFSSSVLHNQCFPLKEQVCQSVTRNLLGSR